MEYNVKMKYNSIIVSGGISRITVVARVATGAVVLRFSPPLSDDFAYQNIIINFSSASVENSKYKFNFVYGKVYSITRSKTLKWIYWKYVGLLSPPDFASFLNTCSFRLKSWVTDSRIIKDYFFKFRRLS